MGNEFSAYSNLSNIIKRLLWILLELLELYYAGKLLFIGISLYLYDNSSIGILIVLIINILLCFVLLLFIRVLL